MTQLSCRKIESGLLRKGFRKENADHRVFRFYVGGKKTSISTFLSHGSRYKEYNDDLLSKMKRELCLSSTKSFWDLSGLSDTRRL